MISVGYMAKRVSGRPVWLDAPRVTDIYSVSGCISADFADYIAEWRHNGYWFFDTPQMILEVARKRSIDVSDARLFFYEVHELQFDGAERRWTSFGPEPSLGSQVVVPPHKALEGYDVVTFSAGSSAECSPLSCNSLARELDTNEHCLLASFERAQALLEGGRFANTEPGPYRVFAVYSTAWPRPDLTAASAPVCG